jgi:citrate synthase
MVSDEIARGLENVTVAKTRLSTINGEEGELVIGGFPLSELAGNATYEEVVYLLWNDRLPSASERDSFCERLDDRRSLPEATIDLLRAAADDGESMMDALRMATATLSLNGDDGEMDKAITLVARLPTIAATYYRLVHELDVVEPRTDLSHAANYLYLLTGEVPTDAAVRGLETYLTAVVDHGFNASTFTARSIASTESDLVSAITGAVGALKGPLHGGAPGPVLEMLQEIDAADNDPETYLREKLENDERIMGFGHRVYAVRDPRAAVLSQAAERFYGRDDDDGLYELATETETLVTDLLEEYKPGRQLNTNVEFYTAVLLHGLDIPTDLFTPTFAIARVGGWTAHCLEQQRDNRIIRPRAKYVGETGRTWSPVETR